MKPYSFAGIVIAISMALSGTGAMAQSVSGSSSSSLARCMASCPDGYQYRKCGEDGEPVYYFADPCFMHSSASSSSRASCAVICPDGYRQRMCTDNGYPIENYGDPCMNHSSTSSSSSLHGAASCGPNTLLCVRTMRPACVDGIWTCKSASSSSAMSTHPVCRDANIIRCRLGLSPVCTEGRWVCKALSSSSAASLQILSLDPAFGPVGTTVTITGRGFARRGNTVHFADSTFPNIASRDGGHLRFRIPNKSVHQCLTTTMCPLFLRVYAPATYEVSVTANGKTSEPVPFTIVAE